MLQEPGMPVAALRKAYHVALGMMVLLLALSIAWYRERMLFIDPAFIAFDVMRNGRLSIQEHRYGAFVTQMWPLIGSKLGMSLKTILLLYSASFYGFYVVVMLVLGRLRQFALGILLALFYTLIVSDVFFWPNNEVLVGTAWAMLFFGMYFHELEQSRVRWWMELLMTGSLFMAVFSHFIVIVPLSFLWIYRLLQDRELFRRRRTLIRVLAYLAILVGMFVVKFLLGRYSWYDGNRLGPVMNVKPKEIFASFHNPGAVEMVMETLRNYWLLLPITALSVTLLVRNRQWWRLGLYVAYGAGFFSLVCLTYPDGYGRELRFYMESEWQAWAIVLATPVVFMGIPLLKPKLALGLMCFVFAARLYYIGDAYRFFHRRYERLEAITDRLHQRGITKALIYGSKSERDAAFVMDWGTPLESMMLSKLKGYSPQVTFKSADTSFKASEGKLVFLAPFGQDHIGAVNGAYFQLDTMQPYKVLLLKEIQP